MKKNKMKSIVIMCYLLFSFFLAVFLLSVISQAFSLWFIDKADIFCSIKDNIGVHLQIGGAGALAGFVLWLFKMY
ncbi:hypothetical protein CE143_21575 [Photorhabdus luminescens]|uniref:Uncharacterized protein n=1 Tax=Photorhabdus akhurstii TaxID=171438 RepID=A0ABX8M1J3_9GAMM|nr:hypothetical protein [Photorhabdus akhurstii]MBS9430689.1 hypothetical protein [Photorhabdus akhurstii]QXF35479.1 hypothetical protein B0X70_21530 [Photorhabdus akhurstii]UJD77311.1 hypothetical protein CE143_21575 [Photorhabdus luminescens]